MKLPTKKCPVLSYHGANLAHGRISALVAGNTLNASRLNTKPSCKALSLSREAVTNDKGFGMNSALVPNDVRSTVESNGLLLGVGIGLHLGFGEQRHDGGAPSWLRLRLELSMSLLEWGQVLEQDNLLVGRSGNGGASRFNIQVHVLRRAHDICVAPAFATGHHAERSMELQLQLGKRWMIAKMRALEKAGDGKLLEGGRRRCGTVLQT
jgi:hypothetical protein